MRVLVAYGSKMGGTAGIAAWIAEQLRSEGLEAEARPAGEVDDVAPYDAVLVGAGLYANRWQRDASRFVKRHTKALREKRVWFFSSGPLDDSAAKADLPPVSQVQRLMQRVSARGHVTFGGRMPPDPKGFLARSLAKRITGDWRDPARVRPWATEVAEALRPGPAPRRERPEPPPPDP